MARTMRMTVPNSGLPVSPSALYRLSRFKPEFFAISLMPRARATTPRASRTRFASPVSSAAVMAATWRSSLPGSSAASNRVVLGFTCPSPRARGREASRPTRRSLPTRGRAAELHPPSVNQAGAGRFFERFRQGAVLRTIGSADRGDPAQVIERLIAVALLDLPQAVIIPGQYVVRIGFQRALVPDLRGRVVAERAIGIADQVGHVGMIVLTERMQLVDPSGIVVAVVDRRIGF